MADKSISSATLEQLDAFNTAEAGKLSGLVKSEHSKNITLADWNELIHASDISFADIRRLYEVLVEAIPALEEYIASRTAEYPEVVDGPGTRADAVMSQKASTEAFVAKATSTFGLPRAHCVAANGLAETLITVSEDWSGNSIPRRGSDGTLKVANPTADFHATNKKYVEDHFAAKLSGGEVPVGEPTADDHATPRSYVLEKINDRIEEILGEAPEAFDTLKEIADYIDKDTTGTTAINKKLSKHEKEILDNRTAIENLPEVVDTTGTRKDAVMTQKAATESFVPIVPYNLNGAYGAYLTDGNGFSLRKLSWVGTHSDSIAVRGTDGVLQVGYPTANNHAATKKYVDDEIDKALGEDSVEIAQGTGTSATAVMSQKATTDAINSILHPISYSGIANPVSPSYTPIYVASGITIKKGKAYIFKATATTSLTVFAAHIYLFHDSTNLKYINPKVGALEAGIRFTATEDIDDVGIRIEFSVASGATLEWSFEEDTHFVAKTDNTTGLYQAYCNNAKGTQVEMLSVNHALSAWSIARRYDNGRLRVGTPEDTADATTKTYVDAATSIRYCPTSSIDDGVQLYYVSLTGVVGGNANYTTYRRCIIPCNGYSCSPGVDISLTGVSLSSSLDCKIFRFDNVPSQDISITYTTPNTISVRPSHYSSSNFMLVLDIYYYFDGSYKMLYVNTSGGYA